MDFKKGLFYGNFSSPKLGFLENTYGISTILRESITPFYVWTDVGPIVEFEQTVLSKELKEKFNTEGLIIFLYEIMSSDFLELDSIQTFVKNNKLTNVTVNACEYNISLMQDKYPEFKLQTFDIFLRSIKNSAAFSNIKNNITKHFWCGNMRYAAHRHLIVAYLTEQYSGNYSWHFSCKYDVLATNRWFDLEKLKQTDINRFNKIKNGINILENNQLMIDIDTLPITVDTCYKFYSPDNYTDKSEKLVNSYGECFCAIVTETIYESNLGYISEKTARAVNARLPFIIVSGPNSLAYFKKLGFKTFDRWWDESYDQEHNHTTRLLKIFDLIDTIGNTPISELHKKYIEMTDVLEYNFEVLKNLSRNRMIM